MKGTNLALACLLATLMLSMRSSPAQAQNTATNADLSVFVAAHKTELVLGEPLIMRILVTNAGPSRVQVHSSRPEIGRVEISSDGQSYKPYSDGFPITLTFAPRFLEAGQVIVDTLMVLENAWYDSKDGTGEMKKLTAYAFPEAGTYFVRGLYGHATSAPVQIIVKEPQGDDPSAWEILKAARSFGQCIQPWGISDQCVQEFNAILDKYPKSVYSQYLALSFAKYYKNRMDKANTAKYSQLSTTIAENAWVREEAFYLWTTVVDLATAKTAAGNALAAYPNGHYKDQFQAILDRQPPVKDPLTSAEDDLKALGYDLMVLSSDKTISSNSFDAVYGTTDNDLLAGKISSAQYDATVASRFKTWVLENLKPTLTNALPTTTNSVPPSTP